MNIYFSGLGGVGIGPLTEIARDAGHTVMGSDVSAGLVTDELRAQGITVNIGQDGTFLQACHDKERIDWFVYTASLPADHPELLLAEKLGIRTSKRDEFLAYIIQEKDLKLIAISGTHGKTTTTGMVVWTMQQLGIPVSYSVGSTLTFGPSGKFDPKSEYFVYECDEFDRNFLHFNPHLSIVTSIDYDHPDTYPTENQYRAAFRQFLDQSELTVLWDTDAAYIETQNTHTDTLSSDDTLNFAIAGQHNRRNATLVAQMFKHLPYRKVDAVNQALNDFPGTNRRFEKLANGLYSDYGHHPKEIAATLQMARELSDNVVLVYQPHQNRRQHHIKDEYIDQFELASHTYWLPTYLSREDPSLAVLAPEELTQHLTNKSSVTITEMNDTLWETMQQHIKDGALVLCMGAGSIDMWVREQRT